MPFKNPLCQEQEPMKTKNQGNMQLFYLGISLPIMYFATKEWKNMKTSAFTIWLLKIKMTFTFYQAPSWKLQNRQFYHLAMKNWEGLTFKKKYEKLRRFDIHKRKRKNWEGFCSGKIKSRKTSSFHIWIETRPKVLEISAR